MRVAIKLQRAPNASPAMIEAGNSSRREAKALQQTTTAVRVLMIIKNTQRGVPRESSSLSGTYLKKQHNLWTEEGHQHKFQEHNETCQHQQNFSRSQWKMLYIHLNQWVAADSKTAQVVNTSNHPYIAVAPHVFWPAAAGNAFAKAVMQ